ncbi:YqzE family protein [Aneurinibacillus uraniidurans]|uniref:YqzE family protein n=1 Tax=Aneurinibacillus uraniidurans TaxID=2966586 RepID=UPI0023492C81|nr:YqzE family protein [Aneurinibacillus sp. B1]WCN38881.1 YqzE family protein [Aneurinibacillus sp. B1]
MSSQEYVRYLTQRFVTYVETPKQERPKRVREPWSYRWFGLLPLALGMLFHRRPKRRTRNL